MSHSRRFSHYLPDDPSAIQPSVIMDYLSPFLNPYIEVPSGTNLVVSLIATGVIVLATDKLTGIYGLFSQPGDKYHSSNNNHSSKAYLDMDGVDDDRHGFDYFR